MRRGNEYLRHKKDFRQECGLKRETASWYGNWREQYGALWHRCGYKHPADRRKRKFLKSAVMLGACLSLVTGISGCGSGRDDSSSTAGTGSVSNFSDTSGSRDSSGFRDNPGSRDGSGSIDASDSGDTFDSGQCLRLAGSTSMEELSSALAEGFMDKYPGVTVTVEFIGSSAGGEALMNGKADIANISRSLGSEEKAGGLQENIVAADGIVICVDTANEVTGLTLQQLKDIYTGRIVNWSQVGGQDLPVVVVGREAGSGTREAFEKLLGLDEKCSYANIMDSTGAVMIRVARTPGAIGYMSLDGVGEEIRVLSIDGTLPVLENISAGKYFLNRPYIMAVKGEMAGQSSLVQAWFDYVYSCEGQSIIEMAGLVPLQKESGSESSGSEQNGDK